MGQELAADRVNGDGFAPLAGHLDDAGLFVEMVMPRAEFEEFCATQGVQPTEGRLPAHDGGSSEHEWDWSLRDARDRHFRHEP